MILERHSGSPQAVLATPGLGELGRCIEDSV